MIDVGSTEPAEVRREGIVDADSVEAVAGMLDLPMGPTPGLVPPMWHWFQLLDIHRQSDLGPDGHAVNGLPRPPESGLRRMFAGGRTTHHGLLRTGVHAIRASKVVAQTEKQGRTGRLRFRTVRHEYWQGERLVVVDEHDIVYREAAGELSSEKPDIDPDLPPEETAVRDRLDLDVDPPLMFRFSALTRNAHRIHYDQAYAATEGHAGLVVHGPLQVILMVELLRRGHCELIARPLRYKLMRPVIGPQRLTAERAGGVTTVNLRNAVGTLVARTWVPDA